MSFEIDLSPGDIINGFAVKLVAGPEGDAEADRVIALPKLLILETVMVLMAFEPGDIETEDGLDESSKSGRRNSSNAGPLTCPARGASPHTFSIVGRKL